MKYHLFFAIMIFLLLAGCNNKTAENTNTNVPAAPEEKFSCSVFETEDGVYINNTGDSAISTSSVTYTISWIDTAENGLHEKDIEISKEYQIPVTPGNTAKIDSLSVCLPPEKKTKNNLFKCNAKVVSPCSAEHLFVMSYYYNSTSQKESFENPSLDEYIEMYNALKAEFG